VSGVGKNGGGSASGRADADDRAFLEGLLERALRAGARQAEVFHKRSRGRELARDGSLTPGAPRGASVSAFEEEGLALRVKDEAGRYGLAWSSGPLDDPDALIAAALFAARAAASAADDAAAIATAPEGPAPDVAALRLADPEGLALPEARLHELLGEAEQVVAAEADGAVDLDRLRLGEVLTEVTLLNSEGRAIAWQRTLATLTITLAPVAEGARAVIEERVAVRVADLDARGAVRDAIARALPQRTPVVQPPDARLPVVLEPRAAATLMAVLAPLALHGAFDAAPGLTGPKSALDLADDPTVSGAAGSAPFDGCGAPSRAILLIEAGRTAAHRAEGAAADPAGRMVRASYRDRPLPGLRALHVTPRRRTVEEPERSEPGGSAPDGSEPGGSDRANAMVLSIAALDVAPSGRRLTIRRGDFRRGSEVVAPADGLIWEGKVETLVRAIGATGNDPDTFHPGLPVTTPSLRLYGLGPWRSENPDTPSTSIRL
jgi:predicted Zn-dependent protease